eukprot:GHVH01006660.1.p1 GENE.GHVH01006660.1~~GHVH01006660.1.p1  ORF type:complete len:856 (+),score=127.80 GHVH01006660.1:74-2641(+)
MASMSCYSPPGTSAITKDLIESCYVPKNTSHLLNNASPLVDANEEEIEDRSSLTGILHYCEGHDSGTCRSVDHCLSTLECIATLDESIQSVSGRSIAEVGLAVAANAMHLFEVIAALVHHQASSVRTEALAKVTSFFSDAKSSQMIPPSLLPRYSPLKQLWTIRFLSTLRTHVVAVRAKRPACSSQTDVLIACGRTALSLLTAAPILPVSSVSGEAMGTTDGAVKSELMEWVSSLELAASESKGCNVPHLLNAIPVWLFACLRIGEGYSGERMSRAIGVLSEATSGFPDMSMTGIHLPALMVEMAGFMAIGKTLELPEFESRFWGTFGAAVSVYIQCESSEENGLQDISAYLFALWKLSDICVTDRRGRNVKIGYYLTEEQGLKAASAYKCRVAHVRELHSAYRSRRDILAAILPDGVVADGLEINPTLSKFLRSLITNLYSRLMGLQFIHHSFVFSIITSLNDLISLVATLHQISRCSCGPRRSEDCFCSVSSSILTLFEVVIPKLMASFHEGDPEGIYEGNDKDSVIMALLFMTDELHRLNSSKWLGWSTGWAAVAQLVQAAWNEALFNNLVDSSSSALGGDAVSDITDQFEAYLLHLILSLDTQQRTHKPSVLSLTRVQEEHLKIITNQSFIIWSSNMSVSWRVKHRAIRLLLLMMHIMIPTQRAYGVEIITRVALEGTLFPVAAIREDSQSLFRLLGRYMVSWDSDRISNACIAPLFDVVINSNIQLKTEGPYSARWYEWIQGWHLIDNESVQIEAGLFKYNRDVNHRILYKLILSAYRSLASFLIGLDGGCCEDPKARKLHEKSRASLVETVEAQIRKGVDEKFAESVQELMTTGIQRALHGWLEVKVIK